MTKSIALFCLLFQSGVISAQALYFEPEAAANGAGANALARPYSPFDTDQLDPLISSGIRSQELGNHEQALVAFQKAFEVARIQNGLFSESQVPIIESIISSEIELKRWEAVNKNYEYLEHLYGKIYTVDNPEFNLALQKISSWHVNALDLNLDGQRVKHLREAHKIFKKRLQIAEVTAAPEDPIFEILNESIGLSEKILNESIGLSERELYLYSGAESVIFRARSL